MRYTVYECIACDGQSRALPPSYWLSFFFCVVSLHLFFAALLFGLHRLGWRGEEGRDPGGQSSSRHGAAGGGNAGMVHGVADS